MTQDDAYDGIRYRGLIAWSARLEREWPFLTARLAAAPEPSVIDLGCGPGEHLARLAKEGWRVLGIDRSRSQIEDARRHHPDVTFVQGAMEEVAALTRDVFGAALCLGNVVPSLNDADLARLLQGLGTRLLPGGVLLIQLLDYAPILAGTKRALPVTVRPDEDGGETVFLRVYAPDPERGYVQFLPTTLGILPEAESPLEVRSSHRVRHRAWIAEELEARLRIHGFGDIERFGGMDGSPHEPDRSQDVILLARRT